MPLDHFGVKIEQDGVGVLSVKLHHDLVADLQCSGAFRRSGKEHIASLERTAHRKIVDHHFRREDHFFRESALTKLAIDVE